MQKRSGWDTWTCHHGIEASRQRQFEGYPILRSALCPSYQSTAGSPSQGMPRRWKRSYRMVGRGRVAVGPADDTCETNGGVNGPRVSDITEYPANAAHVVRVSSPKSLQVPHRHAQPTSARSWATFPPVIRAFSLLFPQKGRKDEKGCCSKSYVSNSKVHV